MDLRGRPIRLHFGVHPTKLISKKKKKKKCIVTSSSCQPDQNFGISWIQKEVNL